MLNGPIRHELGINCGSNCFGQGARANATIGRALQLTLLNVGGGKPGIMDRADPGLARQVRVLLRRKRGGKPLGAVPCPRRGFQANDSDVTALSTEPPHNINDHGSTSGIGILETVAGTISQTGSNNIYGNAPLLVAFGPEHAATLKRDGWTVEAVQEKLYETLRRGCLARLGGQPEEL